MVMHLRGEPFSLKYGKALGFEALALVDDRVASPRPVDGRVGFGYGGESFLEDLDGLLHFLGRAFLRNQQSVLRVDGDEVFAVYEDHRLQNFVSMGEVSLLSDFYDFGFRTSSVREFFQGVETSEVGPSDVYGKHAYVIRLFEEAVVDGKIGKVFENLFHGIVLGERGEILGIGLLKLRIEYLL